MNFEKIENVQKEKLTNFHVLLDKNNELFEKIESLLYQITEDLCNICLGKSRKELNDIYKCGFSEKCCEKIKDNDFFLYLAFKIFYTSISKEINFFGPKKCELHDNGFGSIGCFATEKISKGDFICLYPINCIKMDIDGEIFTVLNNTEKNEDYYLDNQEERYFNLDRNTCLVPDRNKQEFPFYGGFLNSSYEEEDLENCEKYQTVSKNLSKVTTVVYKRNNPLVMFFASKDIEPGEEIYYYYDYSQVLETKNFSFQLLKGVHAILFLRDAFGPEELEKDFERNMLTMKIEILIYRKKSRVKFYCVITKSFSFIDGNIYYQNESSSSENYLMILYNFYGGIKKEDCERIKNHLSNYKIYYDNALKKSADYVKKIKRIGFSTCFVEIEM